MEHGVAVVAVMAAGTGGGSGVRSDVLFGEVLIVVSQQPKGVEQKFELLSAVIRVSYEVSSLEALSYEVYTCYLVKIVPVASIL